jgi:hypothetical protein
MSAKVLLFNDIGYLKTKNGHVVSASMPLLFWCNIAKYARFSYLLIFISTKTMPIGVCALL